MIDLKKRLILMALLIALALGVFIYELIKDNKGNEGASNSAYLQ